MAEHMPTDAEVRECFVDGAEGDFIGEDFDRWLAEVRRERDEARQQVADLRAGIEALLPGETVNVYAGGGNLVSQRRVVDPDHLRALLAGSGEQPGEDHAAELSDGTTPTLPPVEDVARLLYERFSQNRLATWDVLGDVDDGPGSTREWYRDRAREVLELLPGRTEAEVRQDEAERIAAWVTADEPSDTLVLLADALRRGDHRG